MSGYTYHRTFVTEGTDDHGRLVITAAGPGGAPALLYALGEHLEALAKVRGERYRVTGMSMNGDASEVHARVMPRAEATGEAN